MARRLDGILLSRSDTANQRYHFAYYKEADRQEAKRNQSLSRAVNGEGSSSCAAKVGNKCFNFQIRSKRYKQSKSF